LLLREAAADAKELVRAELSLARQEFGEDLRQMRRAALLGGGAVALSLVFLSTLAFALVLTLGGTVLVALGVAGGLLVVAGGLGAFAYRALPRTPLRRSRARLHPALASEVEREQAPAQPPRQRLRASEKQASDRKGRFTSIAATLKQTGAQWSDDEASRLAASLALYTLLSVAPLLVIAISVAGMVFGADAARGQISQQISTVVGPEAKRRSRISLLTRTIRAPAS